MSTPTDNSGSEQLEPNAESVAGYLRRHLDFFNDFPDVLCDIELRHSSGDAISLLERQVTTLRDENKRTKIRFDELVQLATANQALIQRIHSLALAPMEAAGPQAIFSTLSERLAQDFNADHAATFVFGKASFVEATPLPEFVGSNSPIGEVFGQVLSAMQPQCGPLDPEQSELLVEFGIPNVGSAAALPLSGHTWHGLLLITSDDESRFNLEMGTDFLAYLGDVVSLIVDPWVNKGEKS